MNGIHRSEVGALRRSLQSVGAVVAVGDENLRYVWIDNPHPDFDPTAVVGKRDDELLPADEAAPLVSIKREAWKTQAVVDERFSVQRSDGLRVYSLIAYPITTESGRMEALLTVGVEVGAAQRAA